MDLKRAFAPRDACVEISRSCEHDGVGPIAFRRVLDAGEFESNVDFVDLTIVPPGSTIGRHTHTGNEELYFISAGTPIVRVDGVERRLARGDVTVVRSGGWHELINDTQHDVEIFVVQVHV